MASDIARPALLPFTPDLKPFGEARALFFCKSLLQMEKVVTTGSVLSQGIFVTVNKWVPKVNTSIL